MILALVVIAGENQGRRFALRPGAFRLIGRSEGGITGTNVVNRMGVRRLEDEDHTRMSDHLTRRATLLPAGGLLAARGSADNFDRDDDIELDDHAVSQTHAMLFCDEAGLSIVDVASRNGTWVNGDRVLESVLVEGDLVRVGETRISVLR